MFQSKLAIFVVFLSLSQILPAQTLPREQKIYYQKDTVVVIGNRYEIPLKHNSNSYTVLDKEQISQFSTHSILEAVEVFSPSAFILDKKILGYGVGTAGGGGIYMRGLGGKPNTGVLVLINGHPDLMGIFGHPLPDVYGMDDVNKVEIITGPASTVFGSNAMGGVINLTTGPDYSNLLKLRIEGGSFNTYNATINFAKLVNHLGFYFTISKKQSSGHIEKTDFSSYHFQAGLDYKLNTHWHLSLQGRYVPYQFDDPARDETIQKLDTYGNIKRGMAEIILKNSFSKINGSTQIYTNLGRHKFFDGFESDDYTIGFSTYQQVKLNSSLNLALGADLIYYGGKANTDNIDHKLNSSGFYALLHFTPFYNLHFNTGLRYQHLSTGLNKLLPLVGLSYNPAPGIKLFTNYQSGFRFPTIRDLYLFPISNPALSDEETKSFDAGIDISILKYSGLKLTYFNNKVSDLIQTIANPAAPPPVKLFNSGNASQWGIEFLFNSRITELLFTQISYSFIEPGNLTAFNPARQVKFILNYNYSNFSGTFVAKYINRLFTENNSRSKLPDYFVANMQLACITGWGEINLKLNNLFDRKYYVLTNYRAPGFNIQGGINFNL